MAKTTKKEITKNILIKNCSDMFDVYVSYNGDRDYFAVRKEAFKSSAAKIKKNIIEKSNFSLSKDEVNFIYKRMKDVMDQETAENTDEDVTTDEVLG